MLKPKVHVEAGSLSIHQTTVSYHCMQLEALTSSSKRPHPIHLIISTLGNWLLGRRTCCLMPAAYKNADNEPDGKYSERLQLPMKATADCHHNGGARLMEQPLPQCWSTKHVPSWIRIFGTFTESPQVYPIAKFGGFCRQQLATLATPTIKHILQS